LIHCSTDTFLDVVSAELPLVFLCQDISSLLFKPSKSQVIETLSLISPAAIT
jgi:hypothetical protein